MGTSDNVSWYVGGVSWDDFTRHSQTPASTDIFANRSNFPNISPNTSLKIEYIRKVNKMYISLLKGLYGYIWDSLGPISDGGGGIRTHGTLADTLVFKTRALNHSTTPPGEKN